ncbi:leucine-rich repeat protein [Prevotella fusca]
MRKIKWYLLTLLLALLPSVTHAYTQGEVVKHDGCYYKVIDLANFYVSIIGTDDAVAGHLTVPGTFDDDKGTTFTVTEVGGDESYKCKNVTSVTLPETVVKLQSSSFAGASLTDVSIPKSVKWIVHTAFYDLQAKPKFTVDAVNQFFSSDTDGCLYSKDKKEFYSAPSALNPAGGTYNIHESVEKIYSDAFLKVAGLKKLVFPKNLQDVELGYPSVTPTDDIEEFAIAGGGTTEYRVIDGVLFKNNTLVDYPRGKTTVDYKVPDGITEIEWKAIESVKAMKTIDLNDVTKLNTASLFKDDNLEVVTLPAHLSTVGVEGGISNCNAIKEYKTPTDCDNFEAIDGVVYSKGDHSTLYFFPCDKDLSDTNGKYTISSEVKTIAGSAFMSARHLTELVIPTSVETIRKNAFTNALNMTKVTFEEESHITTMEEAAFSWCRYLEEVTLPKSLTKLTNVFDYCNNLKTINVPDGSKLTTIGQDALKNDPALTTVNFLGSNELTTIESGAFQDLKNLETINIPKGVTDIKENAFMGCTGLKHAIFADDAEIQTIGAGAFASCGLESIDIPNSVTTLEREAFRNCAALNVVNVSKNLTDISPEAFKYCENLTDINVDRDNPVYSSIDGYLLSKDKQTLMLFPHGKVNSSYTLLPPSITKIGDFAFYECTGLTNVMIPNKVTSIGTRAFSLCKNLNTIAFLCDAMIPATNIDQRPNYRSFDNGDGGTTNMPANINIYVRKELLSQYQAEPFYQQFKSTSPSFEENKTEYLQVSGNSVDMLSTKSTVYTFVVPTTVKGGSLHVALIGDYAFQNASNKIKEVVVKDNVGYIGGKAFKTVPSANSSTIKSVFFIGTAPTKDMLSTTKFELNDTGDDYNEVAGTTTIYVKKSAVNAYKTAWTKTKYDMATHTNVTSPFNFIDQIEYKIHDMKISNKYGTFAREFDTDFSDYYNENGKPVGIAAFAAGSAIRNGGGDYKYDESEYHVRMRSIDEQTSQPYSYIPAGVGVLLKLINEGEIQTPADFYYTIGEKDDQTYTVSDNIMKGVTEDYAQLSVTATEPVYIMQGGVFHKDTSNVPAFTVHRAYMKPGTMSAGAKLRMVFDDETTVTGISTIDAGQADQTDAYYNLNGQRVGKPAHGVYIKNGKKVIIK